MIPDILIQTFSLVEIGHSQLFLGFVLECWVPANESLINVMTRKIKVHEHFQPKMPKIYVIINLNGSNTIFINSGLGVTVGVSSRLSIITVYCKLGLVREFEFLLKIQSICYSYMYSSLIHALNASLIKRQDLQCIKKCQVCMF